MRDMRAAIKRQAQIPYERGMFLQMSQSSGVRIRSSCREQDVKGSPDERGDRSLHRRRLTVLVVDVLKIAFK